MKWSSTMFLTIGLVSGLSIGLMLYFERGEMTQIALASALSEKI
jgi:hypothetical protein